MRRPDEGGGCGGCCYYYRSTRLQATKVCPGFSMPIFIFFSLEHSMNLMSLKLNNNRHTKTWKNCHCLGLSSAVVVEAASTASAFIWSSHPSRQLKISHYLECYHFKNVIMGMPKTGHNFGYRDRVCS